MRNARGNKRASDEWRDGEDGFDYAGGLSRVRAPSLLIAGAKDVIAPPSTMAPALKLLGGPAELVIAGREHGFSADYGHADLPIGRRSPDEIHPAVARFLAAHATPHAG